MYRDYYLTVYASLKTCLEYSCCQSGLLTLWVQPVYQQFTLAGDYLFPYWDKKYGFPLSETYMAKRIEEVKAG